MTQETEEAGRWQQYVVTVVVVCDESVNAIDLKLELAKIPTLHEYKSPRHALFSLCIRRCCPNIENLFR